MIGVPADFKRLAFQVLTNSAYIAMQFAFKGRVDKRLPVFCAKHDMNIIFNE